MSPLGKPAILEEPAAEVFDDARLARLADQHRAAFVTASPFPHVVIDDFMDPRALGEVLEHFPEPDARRMYSYDNHFEKKLAFDQVSRLPRPVARVLRAMNDPSFLVFLERLTSMQGLVPDPYFRGGGIHQIVQGGKLDVHLDFNIHPKLRLQRNLNGILYLNREWKESYGGHLELWEGRKEGSKHVLERCARRILPVFNRFVLFDTRGQAYHGHPEPLRCPDGMTRKSLATYYYTAPAQADAPHSTMFLRRPHEPEDAEVEALRERRNRGRLASNV